MTNNESVDQKAKRLEELLNQQVKHGASSLMEHSMSSFMGLTDKTLRKKYMEMICTKIFMESIKKIREWNDNH